MNSIAKLIATAKRATPGGVLTAEDKIGIYRRAEREGLTAEQADTLINATPAAPKAPRVNQQWIDK